MLIDAYEYRTIMERTTYKSRKTGDGWETFGYFLKAIRIVN